MKGCSFCGGVIYRREFCLEHYRILMESHKYNSLKRTLALLLERGIMGADLRDNTWLSTFIQWNWIEELDGDNYYTLTDVGFKSAKTLLKIN